ncbi:ROK family protein [Paeniglutamicibacter sp. NPDC091659]|uniref:ROK family transcriptional regulator n=1 Tax=Paeniglutamicibacter sp. NPDC091659 TaxID=3364389 RepID=UPI003809371B
MVVPEPTLAAPARTGSNLDNVRRSNLAAVLGMAYARRSVSRAEITRATGLNRSTVGGLVAELVELGLVEEREPVATHHAGRPSPVIAPRENIVAIAVNPEVDAVTIGLVSLSGKVLRRIRHDNPRIPTAEEVVDIVAEAVADIAGELQGSFRTVGVGLAVPGLVREQDGTVVLATHLDWHNVPLAGMLGTALGLPVAAANDASTGYMAETLFGAGRGVRNHVYLNGVASGIGGGMAVDGRILKGASGFAGEFGHTLVNSAGNRCHCGARGCLETEVRQEELLAALGLGSSGLERLESSLLEQVSRPEGPDAKVLEVVHRQMEFLADALRGTVNVFNPELIILGGFLGTLFSADPHRMAGLVQSRALKGPSEDVRFARAELGADLLLVGAAHLAFSPFLADPASFLTPHGAPA